MEQQSNTNQFFWNYGTQKIWLDNAFDVLPENMADKKCSYLAFLKVCLGMLMIALILGETTFYTCLSMIVTLHKACL